MEEVVDATGAGGRKVRAVYAAASDKDKEYQQQALPLFSRTAASASKPLHQRENNKADQNTAPKRALSLPAGVPSPKEDALHVGITTSGQSNHSRSHSRPDQVGEQMGLESGGGVMPKEESEPASGMVCPADSCNWHLARSFSEGGVSDSPTGRSELIGSFQKRPRRLGRRATQYKGGNMAMLRGRNLVRAVRGELDRAAGSAQAGQASMQVILEFSTLSSQAHAPQFYTRTSTLRCSELMC